MECIGLGCICYGEWVKIDENKWDNDQIVFLVGIVTHFEISHNIWQVMFDTNNGPSWSHTCNKKNHKFKKNYSLTK
jgi:hypothetical protein